MNNERKIIDSVETLESALASLKEAEKKFSTYTQEQVDKIFLAAASAANKARIPLAKMAVEETGMGVVEDKVIKNNYAAEYIYNAYKNTKTCGIIEEDKAYGIKKIAEPVGVIAAVIPTTNPTSTAIFKCLIGIVHCQMQITAILRQIVDSDFEHHMIVRIRHDPFLDIAFYCLNAFHKCILSGIAQEHYKTVSLVSCADFCFCICILYQYLCNAFQKMFPCIPSINNVIAAELIQIQIGYCIFRLAFRQQFMLSPVYEIVQIPDIDLRILIHELLYFLAIPNHM